MLLHKQIAIIPRASVSKTRFIPAYVATLLHRQDLKNQAGTSSPPSFLAAAGPDGIKLSCRRVMV